MWCSNGHGNQPRSETCPKCEREADVQRALRMGLEICDEYLSQIARCVSQDYARLNEFPLLCAKLGVELPPKKEIKT